MRLTTLLGSIGLTCALASPSHAQQWLEDFDSYLPGPLCAQSLWDEWTGSSGVDANVDNTRSFTTSESVIIVTDNDVVWDYSNSPGGRPINGKWAVSVKTYVPTGATGSMWFILMNEYPSPLQWSVQIEIDATAGKVNDGTANRGIRLDRWVSLVIAIDLDNDRYDSWYGDTTLGVGNSWAGASGTLQLAATDLYGDTGAQGSSGMYFDNVRLDKCAGGPLVLTTKPNPIGPNGTLNFFSESPLLGAGDPGALFLWSINGGLFILNLLPTSYDAAGEFTFSATVPPGLSGLELGFRMFALPAGGKIMLSNEDIVIFK